MPLLPFWAFMVCSRVIFIITVSLPLHVSVCAGHHHTLSLSLSLSLSQKMSKLGKIECSYNSHYGIPHFYITITIVTHVGFCVFPYFDNFVMVT
jgi:hypothetical protein